VDLAALGSKSCECTAKLGVRGEVVVLGGISHLEVVELMDSGGHPERWWGGAALTPES
jgi:hypothetical protein